MEKRIYKILGRGELEEALGTGIFQGSAVDRADGFIHFSTSRQMQETAAKHFSGRTDLVLLTLDTARLPQDRLKWEPSRGGQLFPHLYGPLDMAAVLRLDDLPLGPEGVHIFPAETLHP